MSEKEQKIDLPIYCCYCGPHQRLKDNTFFDNRLQCPKCGTEYICVQTTNELHITIRKPRGEKNDHHIW